MSHKRTKIGNVKTEPSRGDSMERNDESASLGQTNMQMVKSNNMTRLIEEVQKLGKIATHLKLPSINKFNTRTRQNNPRDEDLKTLMTQHEYYKQHMYQTGDLHEYKPNREVDFCTDQKCPGKYGAPQYCEYKAPHLKVNTQYTDEYLLNTRRINTLLGEKRRQTKDSEIEKFRKQLKDRKAQLRYTFKNDPEYAKYTADILRKLIDDDDEVKELETSLRIFGAHTPHKPNATKKNNGNHRSSNRSKTPVGSSRGRSKSPFFRRK
jgi:hypothetical protein